MDTAAANSKTIVLAAGGTGGHLFPAQALAEELAARGYGIHLMTDDRVGEHGAQFPAKQVHVIPSATISLSKPWLLPGRAWRLHAGYRKARRIMADIRPSAVIGFGGYPSFPPLLAAARLGIASCVHEQNAVMGRANRVLARIADRVASSFPQIANLPSGAAGKVTVTGNPVRAAVLERRASPYPGLAADKPFRMLVFGGSQGARFFADFLPKAAAELPRAFLKTLRIVQQCRPEDVERVREAYERLAVRCELQPFFRDMPKRIADSHLVICRAGASTIAELGVIGRPAIMVPLPHALDNDQLRNAESFAREGGGWVRPQMELNAAEFAAFLTRLRYQENDLNAAAQAALRHGRPDAAARLAELAETLANTPAVEEPEANGK